jgi:hypothetical protein
MSVLRREARPRFWPWLLLLIASFTIWVVMVEAVIRPPSLILESSPMMQRLSWWFLPPITLVLTLFSGLWLFSSAKVAAAEQLQQQAQSKEEAQRTAAALAAAQAKEKRQFSLEIRGLGVTIDRYRQMDIWKRLDKTNHPLKSMLSQNPDDYPWSEVERRLIHAKRLNDTFANALLYWVERWPIPVLVADPKRGINQILAAENGSGLAIHMFSAVDSHISEGGDQLVEQLFKLFDENPELPAAVLLSVDTLTIKPEPRSDLDARFVPSLPDSVAAILVTRTDRVDQFIRPFAVDVPYDIDKRDTKYDIIKLWNFYFKQRNIYDKETKKGFDTMPSAYWNEHAKELIAQVDPNGGQGGILPFWNQGKAGFKPTPWVPVRWTKWQIEEYDLAPLVGHLHRPVEIDLKGKNDSAKATAIAAGWQQALATLPDGSVPEWLFYDTGADGKQVIPFSRAMSLDSTPHPLDFSDAAHSYNLSQRIGNTGASSAFVQLGLGTMRSYQKGGVSATVNLRQPHRASIIMISPPTAAEKARNKPNPNNLDHRNDPDPFVSRGS